MKFCILDTLVWMQAYPKTFKCRSRVKTPKRQYHCSAIQELQRRHTNQQLLDVSLFSRLSYDSRSEAVICRPAGTQQRSAAEWETEKWKAIGYCVQNLTNKSESSVQGATPRHTRRPAYVQAYKHAHRDSCTSTHTLINIHVNTCTYTQAVMNIKAH